MKMPIKANNIASTTLEGISTATDIAQGKKEPQSMLPVIGSVVGAAIGSFVAPGIGNMAGSMIGQQIGQVGEKIVDANSVQGDKSEKNMDDGTERLIQATKQGASAWERISTRGLKNRIEPSPYKAKLGGDL